MGIIDLVHTQKFPKFRPVPLLSTQTYAFKDPLLLCDVLIVINTSLILTPPYFILPKEMKKPADRPTITVNSIVLLIQKRRKVVYFTQLLTTSTVCLEETII